MTKRLMPAFLLSLSPALAQASEPLDTNEDGVLNIIEMQAAHPELTPEQFSAMDINDDGLLDAEELAAARADGVLPKVQS